MLKLNAPLNIHGQRRRRVHDLRLLIQYGENLLRGGQGGLQRAKLLRKFLDGLEERTDIGDKDKQRPQRQAASQHRITAGPDHNHHGHDGQKINAGTEDGKGHDLPPVGPKQFPGLTLKLLILFLLPYKYLNQSHAGDMFGEKCIQLRDFVAGNLVGFPGVKTEHKGEHSHHRQQRKGHQSHPHADGQHHHRITQDFYHIFKEPHQNRGKQFIHCLGVIAHPGHQFSHRCGIEETQGKTVNMGKNLFPHAEDDILPHLLEHPGIHRVQHKAQHHEQIQPRRIQNPGKIIAAQRF